MFRVAAAVIVTAVLTSALWIFVYNIAYAPYVSDYSRYLPRTVSRTAIIVNVFLGASLSAIWLICLGGIVMGLVVMSLLKKES